MLGDSLKISLILILLILLLMASIQEPYKGYPKPAKDVYNCTSCKASAKYPLFAVVKGRLGNHMFIVASLIGVAKSSNHQPVISSLNMLKGLFTMNYPELKTGALPQEATFTLTEKHFRKYDNFSVTLNKLEQRAVLCCYLHSWVYFHNIFLEIRKMMTILPGISKRAQRIIHNIPSNIFAQQNLTYVGVHVRRGDIVGNKVYPSAPLSYIQKAMEYYRQRYPHVTFIVCSDDIAWCKKHIASNDTYFIEKQGYQVDFAILSQCNHTIITVGTFSWWAGFLAGGHVVYYKEDGFKKHTNMSQYMLPHWTGLGP